MAQRVVPLRPAGLSDGELVRRAQQGDSRASTRLFRLHAGHVARVLANLVGVHADLPDLTQDVFLTAFRNLDQLREQEAFRSWLTGIAEVCGVSLATVKRRIASARERFVVAARRDARLAEWVQGAES